MSTHWRPRRTENIFSLHKNICSSLHLAAVLARLPAGAQHVGGDVGAAVAVDGADGRAARRVTHDGQA